MSQVFVSLRQEGEVDLLPSPPVLRGRGGGGEGDSMPRECVHYSARADDPLTPTPLPRSTGGEGRLRRSPYEPDARASRTQPRPRAHTPQTTRDNSALGLARHGNESLHNARRGRLACLAGNRHSKF